MARDKTPPILVFLTHCEMASLDPISRYVPGWTSLGAALQVEVAYVWLAYNLGVVHFKLPRREPSKTPQGCELVYITKCLNANSCLRLIRSPLFSSP